MSYILDALRKSEQQRQAADPESVTDRILVNQPPAQSQTKKWLAALVIVNLMALVYFFGFVNKSRQLRGIGPKVSNTSPVPQPPAPVVTSPPAIATPSPPPQIAADGQTVEPVALNGAEQAQPTSIAQMMSVDEDVNATQKPPNPVLEKKTTVVKKQTVTRTVRARNQPVNVDATPVKNPPRYEMPAEIERERPVYAEQSRPKLTINVYSYAPQPEDRFVMINMTKYKVGQLIKDGIKLKEIHPDHIVLQQGGTTFKMDRP